MTVEIENGRVVGYLTTKEYGALHGISDAGVRMLIHKGQIETLKIGDVNWIKEGTPKPTKSRRGR